MDLTGLLSLGRTGWIGKDDSSVARHDLTLGTGKNSINSSQASTSFQQLPVAGWGEHRCPPRALHFQPPCLAHALPIAAHPGPISTLPGRRFPLPTGSPCNFPLPSVTVLFPAMCHCLSTCVSPMLHESP